MAPENRAGVKVDLMLDYAGPLLDILDTALDIVSVPGIGFIPKGLSLVLESIKLARANRKVLKDFMEQAKALASIIEATLKAARTKVTEDRTGRALEGMSHSAKLLSSDVNALKRTIAVLVDRASHLERHRSRIGRAIKSFIYGSRNEEILSDMQGELDDAINEFKLKSHLALNEGVNEIYRLLKRAEEDRVLGELARADAGYRAVEYLKSGFIEGTRKALLDDIRQWATSRLPLNTRKRFFALFASAGMGKSAVAHRLCRHLDDIDFPPSRSALVLGASFFFVRDAGGNADKASALLLPPTIAWQLASCDAHPVLRAIIANAARSYTARGEQQQLEHAFRGLLEPLSKANDALDLGKRVFLVIDGLDECSDKDLMTETLRRLLTLVKKLPWLYIFTASRPERHIMEIFESPEAATVVHIQDLGSPSDSKEDVELYLRNTVLPMSPYSEIFARKPNLLQGLIDRAGGLFIFARIAFQFLRENRNSAVDALDLILQPEEGGPVAPLDRLYLQIFSFAFPAKTMQMFPHQHAHLLAFLHILLLNQDRYYTYILQPGPLALFGHQLCQTLPIRARLSAKAENTRIVLLKEDIDSIIRSLRSVLSIKKDGHVAPLHATLGEFLLDPTRCTDALYRVDAGEGHAGLAYACLGAASSLGSVTDMLAGLHDRDSDFRYYAWYALRRFDDHLDKATWTEPVNQHVAQSVRTAQLPLMARLSITDTSLGVRVRHRYRGLQKFYQKSTNGAYIISESEEASDASVAEEYLKFMAYCLCLMDHVRWHPGEDWPEISGEAAKKYLAAVLWGNEGSKDLAEEVDRWDADRIEVGRYRSVVLALKAEIDQDERARSLWYNFSIEISS